VVTFALLTLLQAPDPAALSWLAGCWQRQSGTRLVEEVWTAPAGDGMLGLSRTIDNGRTIDHEFLQIRVDSERLVYVARPARQPEAAFGAASIGPREAVFENPAHDFPQRIIYRLREDGSLLARIEGLEKGRPRAADFPLRRVACPATP